MTDSPLTSASANTPTRFERESFTWRTMTVTDLEAAHRLSLKLGWPHRIDDWRQVHALGEGIILENLDGEVLGTGLCFNQGPLATLGLVVISDAWQGLGLGREMMVRLIALAGSRSLLLVATTAGQPLYRKLGFEPCNRVCQYQGIVTDVPPVPLLPGLRAMAASDQAALLALSPESPAYAAVVQSATQGAVIENAGVIEGVALKRTFGRGAQIGPILASSAEQAQALVLALLAESEGEFIRIDLMDPDDDSWLTASGLNCVDDVIRMCRGKAVEEPLTRFGLMSQAMG